MKREAARTFLSGLIGVGVKSMEKINGGRNSRVFKIECEDRRRLVVKFYHHSNLDERDRLGAEYYGLKFLRQQGMRNVPMPVTNDLEHRCAIFEFIEGQNISANQISKADIDSAALFLADLNRLSTVPDSRALPDASEACFSIKSIAESLQRRFNKLAAVSGSGCLNKALHAFLNNDFRALFHDITLWCQAELTRSGGSFQAPVSKKVKTLSPSDFGFHNALRRADGTLAFLDFEYFGWDDPAKMISDFLLHPAIDLAPALKKRFLAKTIQKINGEAESLIERIKLVYPFFGLKWCLILLNEFLPNELSRRNFARDNAANLDAIQTRQLTKSREMLRKIKSEYESFPYTC